MVSSEMPELLGVCDRILVMSGGPARRRGGRCQGHHAGRDHDAGRQVRIRGGNELWDIRLIANTDASSNAWKTYKAMSAAG